VIRLALACACLLTLGPACQGSYQRGTGRENAGAHDRESDGRTFDFVSTKPDGAEWTIRVRGTGMWVAYSEGRRSDELGTIDLSGTESDKLWSMIDVLDLPSRGEGRIDSKHGTVSLRLRTVTRRGGHVIHTMFVSRNTNDQDVLDLADYLATLVETHRKERPAF
jgi:hypothetical protein